MPDRRFDVLVIGAGPVVGRAAEPVFRDMSLDGFVLSGGERVCADVVIGADGASSRVAEVARLVDSTRVLWGFALRAYVDDPVQVPNIVLWEPAAWRGFPGYGWLFPGVGSRANVGLGLGVLSDRRAGAGAAQQFGSFLAHLWRLGVLDARLPPSAVRNRLGGWPTLGLVGTTPAARVGRVAMAPSRTRRWFTRELAPSPGPPLAT